MINDEEQSNPLSLNRRMLLMAAAGVATSLALPSKSSAQAMSSTPRVLKFSDHEPLGGMRTRFLKDFVFPAIERETNGRLKIEDHWDGEIAGAYDALGAVSGWDSADMATVVPEYTAKELPLHQIFKSFPKGPSGNGQVDFFRQAYSEIPAFTAELEQNNIVPLFFGTGYPVAFFSTKPMAELSGLQGGRWRSASFWHLDYLRNVGASPVTMHWGPEVPAALEAGALDGLMVNVDSGFMLKVHEAAPNVLVSKDLWLGHLYLLAMKKSVWESLADEDKQAIHGAAVRSSQMLGAVMDKSFEAQLDELRAAGANVRILSAQEVDRFADLTRFQHVQSTWAKEWTGGGSNEAASTIHQVRNIIATF